MKKLFERITDLIVFYGFDKPLGTIVTSTGWLRQVISVVFGSLVTHGLLTGKLEDYTTWISTGVLGANFLLESYVKYLSTVKVEQVQKRLGMETTDGWFWKNTANSLQDHIESVAVAAVTASQAAPPPPVDPVAGQMDPHPVGVANTPEAAAAVTTPEVAPEVQKAPRKSPKPRPRSLKSKKGKGKVKISKRP